MTESKPTTNPSQIADCAAMTLRLLGLASEASFEVNSEMNWRVGGGACLHSDSVYCCHTLRPLDSRGRRC